MRIYPKVKKLGPISNFIKKTKIIMTQFAIFLHTLIVGFMIFFMSVVSPIIFKTLNEEIAPPPYGKHVPGADENGEFIGEFITCPAENVV